MRNNHSFSGRVESKARMSGCFSPLPPILILKCLLIINVFELKSVELVLCTKKKEKKLVALFICNFVCWVTEGFMAAVFEALLVMLFPFFPAVKQCFCDFWWTTGVWPYMLAKTVTCPIAGYLPGRIVSLFVVAAKREEYMEFMWCWGGVTWASCLGMLCLVFYQVLPGVVCTECSSASLLQIS